jgi:hypothetical protein
MTSSNVRISARHCQGSEVVDHPRVTRVRFVGRLSRPSCATRSDIRPWQLRPGVPTKDHGAALGSWVAWAPCIRRPGGCVATCPGENPTPMHASTEPTTGDQQSGGVPLYGYPGTRRIERSHNHRPMLDASAKHVRALWPQQRTPGWHPIVWLPLDCEISRSVESDQATHRSLVRHDVTTQAIINLALVSKRDCRKTCEQRYHAPSNRTRDVRRMAAPWHGKTCDGSSWTTDHGSVERRVRIAPRPRRTRTRARSTETWYR